MSPDPEDSSASTGEAPGIGSSQGDLDRLLEAFPAACLSVDDGATISAANQAAAHLLDRSKEELTGTPIERIIPEGLPPAHRPGAADLSQPEVLLREATMPTGEPLTLKVLPGPANDLLGHRILCLEDASSMEEADVELHRSTQDLREANRVLEEFVHGASHDLKEPIRVIEGHLQRLQHLVGKELDEEAKASLGYALEGSRRLKQLVEGLLAYSQAGFREEPMGTVDVQDALDDALANLAARIEATDAKITTDPMPTILADRFQLTLIFQNLIGNAIKFTEPGTTPEIHVGHEATDEGTHLWVEDNGIGIPEEHQDQLFEMFQRLHSQEDYEGNGIGLALCSRMVDRHDGRIWVENSPGQGSTFHVLIGTEPAEHTTTPESSEAQPVQPSTNGGQAALTTLLIDDVEGIRALVRMALESRETFTVVGEASNGEEGIELARETQPELVLLDLSMPGMDGLEALPEIKKASPESQIVIYSGFQSGRLGQEAKARGAIGYIEKGADPDELHHQLEELVTTVRTS